MLCEARFVQPAIIVEPVIILELMDNWKEELIEYYRLHYFTLSMHTWIFLSQFSKEEKLAMRVEVYTNSSSLIKLKEI